MYEAFMLNTLTVSQKCIFSHQLQLSTLKIYNGITHVVDLEYTIQVCRDERVINGELCSRVHVYYTCTFVF